MHPHDVRIRHNMNIKAQVHTCLIPLRLTARDRKMAERMQRQEAVSWHPQFTKQIRQAGKKDGASASEETLGGERRVVARTVRT